MAHNGTAIKFQCLRKEDAIKIKLIQKAIDLF